MKTVWEIQEGGREIATETPPAVWICPELHMLRRNHDDGELRAIISQWWVAIERGDMRRMEVFRKRHPERTREGCVWVVMKEVSRRGWRRDGEGIEGDEGGLESRSGEEAVEVAAKLFGVGFLTGTSQGPI